MCYCPVDDLQFVIHKSQLFKYSAFHTFVAVEGQFYNKRHNLFDALKIVKTPFAAGVVVDNGGQCCAVTAYCNVAVFVFFYNFVYCRYIAGLYLAQTFAAFHLVGEIAPLVFCIVIKAVQPFIANGALAQAVICFNFKTYFICNRLHGINTALVRAGQYNIDVFVSKKILCFVTVNKPLFGKFTAHIVVVVIVWCGVAHKI